MSNLAHCHDNRLCNLLAIKRGDLSEELNNAVFDTAVDALQRGIASPLQGLANLMLKIAVSIFHRCNSNVGTVASKLVGARERTNRNQIG